MNTQNPEHKIPEEILHLIAKSRSQMLKAEDQNQLNAWLNEHPGNKEEMAHFQQILDRVHWQALANKVDLPEAWEKLEAQIQTKRKSRINLVFALRWAALFVLLAGLGFLLLYEGDHLNKQEEEPWVEVLPERMLKASLKLADGSLIALDTAQMQLKESAFEIQNQPGEKLSYSKNEVFKQKASQAVFHELIVPAGARYQLVLADGTKVWMNAASKLTYPVSFSDAERRVKLEGEAYFEVMSSAVPFIVEAGKQEIRVLGTSFNVSAYHEDANFETTLVSGKVLVKTEKDAMISLVPGEQARIDNLTHQAEKLEVETRLYTSWKDDVLYFKEMELRELVKRLERWYAIPIEIKNNEKADIKFTGAIENSRKVEFLLSLIAETTSISYEVENEHIIIY